MDTDILILDDNPTDYELTTDYMDGSTHYIRWQRLSKEDYIEYHKYSYEGTLIQKFLVPDFINEIGLTIEDLKQLKPMLKYLDEEHTYEKVIYNAYIKNNGFYLTDDQLDAAYDEYKKSRAELYKNETEQQ